MGGRLIARQILIGEAEYKKLVRIRYRRHVIGLQQKIVVVGNPQCVKPGLIIDPDVRTERNPLDLRRDAIGGDTVGGKRCDEIQEQSFADSVRGCGEPVLVGDIHRAVQVDLKELFYTSVVARPVARTLAPSAVAFIHQEFVIVDGQNLADAASGREQVRVLVSDSTGDVDGDDAQKIHGGTALGSVLDQRVLHDPYQRVAVGSDRQ